MRIIYGFIAIILWFMFSAKACPNLSDEATMLTCAIVMAGAMAGGK